MRERKGLAAPVPDAEPEVRPASSPRRAGVAEAVPEVSSGQLCLEHAGQRWSLPGSRMLVGRAHGGVGAGLELNDDSVSRRHAEVVAVAGRWEVRDLGSTNGTWVGGRRLSAGEGVGVGEGEVVRFGSVELAVVTR